MVKSIDVVALDYCPERPSLIILYHQLMAILLTYIKWNLYYRQYSQINTAT